MSDKHTGGFIASVVGTLVAMVLFNIVLPLRGWTMGVILPSWLDVLWAMNVSFAAQILGNLVLATYRPAWFYELMQTLFAATGLLATIVFYVIYPLNFAPLVGEWLNILVKVVLIVGIGGSAIALILHLVRFIAKSVQNGFDSTKGENHA
jgi:hypothetical protein